MPTFRDYSGRTIKLRPYKPDPSRLTGDTTIDRDLLRSMGCPTVFKNEEYDGVLTKVSEFGYSLQTYGE